MAKIKKSQIIKLILAVVSTLAIIVGCRLAAHPTFAQETKVVNNLVIFVNFDNKADFVENGYGVYQKMYNSAQFSVKNYFHTVSRGKVQLNTTFLTSDYTVEIDLDYPESYYKPKYSYINGKYTITNQNGYDNRYFLNGVAVAPETDGSKLHVDMHRREQELVRFVLDKVTTGFQGLELDSDDDGYIDSLSLMVNSMEMDSDAWGSLLWPHMTALSNDMKGVKNYYYVPSGTNLNGISGDLPTLNGAVAATYNFLSVGEIFKERLDQDSTCGDVGVLCHELMHTLGAMDYYSYEDNSHDALGELEIMAQTGIMPQYPTTYVRQKMGWVSASNVGNITNSGSKRLYPTTSEKDLLAYKIDLGYKTGEYFLLEVRSNQTGCFDSSLADSGLAIYRVYEQAGYTNPNGDVGDVDYANMYGDDQLYAFRFNDGKVTAQTTPAIGSSRRYNFALLNDRTIAIGTKRIDKSQMGGDSDVSITYTDGTDSQIVVKIISMNSDGSIDFDVTLPNSPPVESTGTGVTPPFVYYVDKVNGKVGVGVSSTDFYGQVQLLLSESQLTKSQFEQAANKVSLTLSLPYKTYTQLLDLPSGANKVYLYYLTDKRGTYSEFDCIQIDVSQSVGNIEYQDAFIQREVVPEITVKKENDCYNFTWEKQNGKVVICKIDKDFKYTTAQSVMENCIEFFLLDGTLGKGQIICDLQEDQKFAIFIVNETGVSNIYTKGVSKGGLFGKSCNCNFGDGDLDFIFGIITLSACALLIKRKR